MKTALVNLSDAEIKRQAANTEIGELRDPRHPGLRFRYLRDRSKGSWYVIQGRWHKVSRYPTLTAKAMIEVLPQVAARLAVDPAGPTGIDTFATLGEVLAWQLDRQLRNRALSDRRKVAIKSMISKHLMPGLGEMRISETTKAGLDRGFFWNMQEEFTAGYVRQAYGILMGALRQARRLDLIAANPMEHMKFTDFVRGKILPKPAGLRPAEVDYVLELMIDRWKSAPSEGLLAVMMLAHGTRLGETRKARWKHVRLEERVWHIPALETKTRQVHELPLTEQMVTLLTTYKAQQEAKGGSAFLFPGCPGKCLSEKQASEVFVTLGAGEWTSHDLRKLARTCWTELGVDHLIGEMLLNHAMRGVTAAYIQTDAVLRKRSALELWHSHLDQHGFTAIHGATDARSHVLHTLTEASNGGASSEIPHAESWSMQNDEKGSGQ